jgi:PhzF family phenazine biosynthesis protein
MGQRIVQVDAFTGEVYRGNPAAVCILPAPAAVSWMQAVAGEMNLSETAFLVPGEDGAFDLRWFTPAIEVDLCGHATLASAHALWEAGVLPEHETALFHTRSGVLTAAMKPGGWIEMDFPATPPAPCPPPAGLLQALGLDSTLYVGKSNFDYLVQVESEKEVLRLEPDFRLLASVPGRGVIVTSSSDRPGIDFVSRFFAPGSGIDEDPVTGSAHCCLGPFWAERLGRSDLLAEQLSARGGTVKVSHRGERVLLAGQAVTVLRGELTGFTPA